MPIKWNYNPNGNAMNWKVTGTGPAGDKGQVGYAGSSIVSLCEGSKSTTKAVGTAEAIGTAYVDTSAMTGVTKIALEGVLSVGGGGASTAANIVLWNKTTNSAAATITTTSKLPTFVSVEFNAPPAGTVYEARLYVSNAGGSTSAAISTMVRLRCY